MWKRISNFIIYNNGFTFLVWFVLLSTGTALAANPDVREAVASSVITSSDTVSQIDNSLIVSMDIEQFDFALRVTNVSEDDYTYYITYSYRTVEVRDSVWKEVDKEGFLTITKAQIGADDFETYVQRQLAEFIESQRKLLVETKDIERMLGQTSLVIERSYSGLIGRFLDTKEILSEQSATNAKPTTTPSLSQGATSTTPTPSSSTASSTNPIATNTPPGPVATSTTSTTSTSTPSSNDTSTPDSTDTEPTSTTQPDDVSPVDDPINPDEGPASESVPETNAEVSSSTESN